MSALYPFLSGLALAMTSHDAPAENAVPPAVTAATPLDRSMAVWEQLARGFVPRGAAQVRIEQRIIWRIAPMPGPARQSVTLDSLRAPAAPRFVERKMGDCIPMAGIAGGRPQSGSRLLLFLRDRRLVAANLEKACSARDFYSGFYVENPNSDGRLCADRDRILARSGARCEIGSFRLLVADD